MTGSNMKHINRKIKAGFIILAVTLLSTACVSSPDEKQPEAIEVANSALSTGVGHYNDNKHELAISYFKNALRDFRSIDHQFGIASSSLNLSKSHLSTGSIATAEAYLEQAKRIIEREDIKQLSDHLSIIESSIAIENNQLAQAKEILQPLLNNSNNAFTLAATQNRTRIAFTEKSDGNYNEAKQWTEKFEQKIKSSTENLSHKARLARFKAKLSDVAATQNKHLAEALSIYRQQTNRAGIAASLQEWGDALIQQDQTDTAKDKLLRALYIRQSLQDKKNSLKTLNSLTKISDDSTTNTWIEKLQNKNFNQWDGFVAAFSRFPE